jgi:hypothetical protein
VKTTVSIIASIDKTITRSDRVPMMSPAPRAVPLENPALPSARQSAIHLPRIAPVAQLDRALPSEGKGHTFESCRARHFLKLLRSFSFRLYIRTWLGAGRHGAIAHGVR